MQQEVPAVVANSCALERCWAWLGLAVEQVAEPLPGRGLRSANLPMVA